MKNPIQTFEPNTRGRDFVVGDLHGARKLLEKFLKEVNFDYGVDRLFSVGDLVDRGEESQRTLSLINEPWFACVLANHEQMMLEAFNGGYMGNFWYQNGGQWGIEAFEDAEKLKKDPTHIVSDSSQELFELLAKVEELPFLITIKMADGRKFHLIHAELPPGFNEINDSVLSSPGKVMQLATQQSRDGDHFLWGRFIFMDFYSQDLSNVEKIKRTVAHRYRNTTGPFNDNLSHIISGHTIMQHPLTILGQTNIDTCAYGASKSHRSWCALTAVELNTWTFYQTRLGTFDDQPEFQVVKPIEVNKEDIATIVRGASSSSTQGTP